MLVYDEDGKSPLRIYPHPPTLHQQHQWNAIIMILWSQTPVDTGQMGARRDGEGRMRILSLSGQS